MLDLSRICESDKTNAVRIQSFEEFEEFSSAWNEINGRSISHEFLKSRARANDLCLFLALCNGEPVWTWSERAYCFDDHPEIEVHTMDELRKSSNDFGEIETGEASVFDLFLEAVKDMGLLKGDSCG